MFWRSLALGVLISASIAHANSAFRDMEILPNGHVRFDRGTELDLEKLQAEIQKMSKQSPKPNIRTYIGKDVGYKAVYEVLQEFQKAGYDRLGFVVGQREK